MQGVRQGDIVEFSFSPSAGHEPAGRRPGLVVSSDEFNRATSMTLICPITTRDNGFPLHVPLPEIDGCYGWVVLEQPRCFDLAARSASVLAHLDVRGQFMKDAISVIQSFFEVAE